MQLTLTSNLWNKVELIQQQALGWVVNASKYHSKQYQRLIQSLTGIESIHNRFETLGIRFGLHYIKASPTNPLRDLVAAIECKTVIACPTSLVIANIHKPDGFQKYLKENEKHAPGTQVPLSAAMAERKLQNISRVFSKRDRVGKIAATSRHSHSHADVSLYINDTFFAFQAIRWRMNTLCIGSRCPRCQQYFYFNHAEKCFGFKDTDALFQFHSQKALKLRLAALILAIRPELL
ncbi:hypothetical protein K7432_002268 [Basidiobolus ranarum]|uniref:Uncharacterized protein n=1 Tax=Basidiobolus ranarum TaxID=34480 RepID=A0ABR2X1T3_9FUNG